MLNREKQQFDFRSIVSTIIALILFFSSFQTHALADEMEIPEAIANAGQPTVEIGILPSMLSVGDFISSSVIVEDGINALASGAALSVVVKNNETSNEAVLLEDEIYSQDVYPFEWTPVEASSYTLFASLSYIPNGQDQAVQILSEEKYITVQTLFEEKHETGGQLAARTNEKMSLGIGVMSAPPSQQVRILKLESLVAEDDEVIAGAKTTFDNTNGSDYESGRQLLIQIELPSGTDMTKKMKPTFEFYHPDTTISTPDGSQVGYLDLTEMNELILRYNGSKKYVFVYGVDKSKDYSSRHNSNDPEILAAYNALEDPTEIDPEDNFYERDYVPGTTQRLVRFDNFSNLSNETNRDFSLGGYPSWSTIEEHFEWGAPWAKWVSVKYLENIKKVTDRIVQILESEEDLIQDPDIIGFELPQELGAAIVIDKDTHTVNIDVPPGIDLIGVTPIITTADYAACSLKSGALADGNAVYTVQNYQMDSVGTYRYTDPKNTQDWTIVLGTSANAISISPQKIEHDKYVSSSNHKDAVIALTLENGSSFTGLSWNSQGLTENADYTVSGSNVTIKTSFLDTLPMGDNTITFAFSNGSAELTVTVINSAPLSLTHDSSFKGKVISANNGAVYYLSPEGQVWSWGRNNEGQLATGTAAASTDYEPIRYPVKTLLDNIYDISDAMALKSDGTVWVWGSNQSGRLGVGKTQAEMASTATPMQVLNQAKYISAGGAAYLAIKEDDSLWVWGDGSYGNLTSQLLWTCEPPFKAMENVTFAYQGGMVAYRTTADGKIYGGGFNSYGQLGIDIDSSQNPMGQIWEGTFTSPIKQISSTGSLTMILLENGKVYACGYSQTGNVLPAWQYISTPTYIMDDVRYLSSHGSIALVIKNDDSLWLWGDPNNPGAGITKEPVKFMEDVCQAVNGLAIKNDGTVYGWGSLAGNDSKETVVTPVQIFFNEVSRPVITKDLSKDAVTYELDSVASPLGVTVTVSGAATGLTYQWYVRNGETNNFTAIQGATSSSYTPPTDTDGTFYYYAQIKNTQGGEYVLRDSLTAKIIVTSNLTPVQFTLSPTDAILTLTNKTSGKKLFARADGKFLLDTAAEYSYTLTKNGYKGKSGSFMLDDIASMDFTLVQAALNPAIDTSLLSQWPYFRKYGTNNGVTDLPTPISSDDAALFWAKKLADYAGVPLIMDDYMYTYSNVGGTAVMYKLDLLTGEILAQQELAAENQWGIIQPLYAEGMIFISLDDQKVQALNAKTLEPLWLYTGEGPQAVDAQPNTPLTYHDGYIYTGFWVWYGDDANMVCLSIADEDPGRTDEAKTATWEYTNGGGFYWAGAYVTDNYMVVGCDSEEAYGDESKVVTLDPKTGKELDRITGIHGDVRSSIAYVNGTIYFTSTFGYFYEAKVNSDGAFAPGSLKKLNLGTVMKKATSTPVVYNNRAYVGVGDNDQFATYGEHYIAVIDLNSFTIAYRVDTKGYPQSSGLLTTFYSGYDNSVYVYFIENMLPGAIRMIKDKPGQTSAELVTRESMIDRAYALFTPVSPQSQYALASIVADQYGTMYYKLDSGYIMAVGSKIEKLEVTKQPDKKIYLPGETFNPAGMTVTAFYANGKTRDVTKYVTIPTTALANGQTSVTVTFDHVMYQNKDGAAGTALEKPSANVSVVTKQASQFAVIFDSKGGSTVSSQVLDPGQKIAEPADPLRAGYQFDGWYKEEICINRWNFATATVSGDITLYAKWIPLANTAPKLKDGAPTAVTATVRIGQAYTLSLADLFEDADSQTLQYKVSINGTSFKDASPDYTYTSASTGTVTLIFKANDGIVDSHDTYMVTLTVMPSGVDKTALNAKIQEALKLREGSYTPGSWSVLKVALTAADAVYTNPGTSQASVDEAIASLNKAIQELVIDTRTITVTFSLLGAEKNIGAAKYIYKKDPGIFEQWISPITVEIPINSQVFYVFDLLLTQRRIEYKETMPNYIGSIKSPNSGDWISEFTNGKYSGWMYTINGTHPMYGLREFTLHDGDVIVWHYTDDYRYEEGSERWADENFNKGTGGNPAGTTDVIASAGNNGTAEATISGSKLEDLISYLNTLTDKKGDKVIIDVDLSDEAHGLNFTIPYELLDAFYGKTETSLEISSRLGTITLDAKAITAIREASKGKDVIISIVEFRTDGLSDETVNLIGNHPVFDLQVVIDGKALTSFNGGVIAVFLPYQLAKDEKAEGMAVYHLAPNGNAVEMTGAKYNKEKKGMVFSTTHFSLYAIVNKMAEAVVTKENLPAANSIAFADVSETYWAKEYIAYLSARGLVSGIGNNLFAPDKDVTRAEFVTLLFNMSGDELPSGMTKFNDVLAIAWYAPYVAWASENGVTSGTSETTFSPDDKITRQDMAVMLKRYMDMKSIKMDKVNLTKAFGDAGHIADYAKDAVSEMQQMGIITGMENGTFEPKNKATRAQAATMIAKILMSIEK